MAATRPLSLDDTAILTDLVQRNRSYLAPWQPLRDESFYTPEGQRFAAQQILDRRKHGLAWPLVILDEGEQVVGRITLNNIIRGPAQSGAIDYWVDEAHTRHGLATTAVGEMVRCAFDDLALHRVEAAILLHNFPSQRVLERNRFTRFGVAPSYLKIAGKWQDHALYQLLSGETAGRIVRAEGTAAQRLAPIPELPQA